MQKRNDITLLIIGAGIYQKPLVEYASKHYRVVLAAPAISSEFSSLVDKTVICDVRDKETILAFARQEHIQGVITDQTDIPVRTVAYIAEQMGLPGIGLDVATLFTDKSLMRKKQKELNIPVLPSATTDSLEEAQRFFEMSNGVVIIKPLDNQGSRGVQTVHSQEEMTRKYQEASHYCTSGKVLVERLATGREFVVEGLVWNGEYKTLICGDTYYFDMPDAFAATMRCFPSEADSLLVERVKKSNEEIIRGFGLKQGITHSEFIIDDGEPYLLETAARGGGVFISSDLISLSTGLETEEFLCNIALGIQTGIPNIRETLCSCGYMAFYLPDGEVVSMDGVDEVTALPYVHRNLLDQIHVGMKIQNHCDKTTRYSIIVSASDRRQLAERMDGIRDKLLIRTQTSRGIEYPIWR